MKAGIGKKSYFMIHQRQYFCEHKNQYLYIFENIKQYRIYSGDVNFQVPGSRC